MNDRNIEDEISGKEKWRKVLSQSMTIRKSRRG